MTRLGQDAHPPQYATDPDATTYWQTPAGQPNVNLSLDLLITYASLRGEGLEKEED